MTVGTLTLVFEVDWGPAFRARDLTNLGPHASELGSSQAADELFLAEKLGERGKPSGLAEIEAQCEFLAAAGANCTPAK